MSDDVKNAPQVPVTVKVDFTQAKLLPTSYAHHMAVQEEDADVILSFFEQNIPIIVPENQEMIIKSLQEKGTPADCVARIRIAKHRLQIFVQLLSETNDRIQHQMKLLSEQYGVNSTDNK